MENSGERLVQESLTDKDSVSNNQNEVLYEISSNNSDG
jgi:hypothetical protein